MSIITNLVDTDKEYKILSDDVTVFPAGFRAQSYIKSKLTTEDNLIKFAKISSNNSNHDQVFRDPDDSNYIIIHLKGYYFRIPETSIPSVENKPVYAFLKLYDKQHNIGKVLANTFETGTSEEAIFVLDVENTDPEPKYEFNGLGFCTAPNDDLHDGDNYEYGCIQIKDSSGNLKIQNLKLDSIEIRSNAADTGAADNTSIDEVFGSELIKTKSITKRGQNLLEIDNNFYAKDRDSGNKYAVDIDASLNIGSDQARGTVNLTSAGNKATAIIGPDGGQIKLPSDTASDNMIFIQNKGNPDWKKFSTANDANTIVCRDGNDIKTGTLNNIEFIRTQSSPTYKAEAAWGPVRLPDGSTVEMYSPTGKLVAYTPTYIKLASGSSVANILGKVDIEIDTQLDAPVKVKLSDTSGISVQYPGTAGASFTVKPGNININAQAPDGKATGLGVTRAFITVGEECDLAFNSKFTVAANSEVRVQAPITINKTLNTYVPLTVGNSSNTDASVTIKSAGAKQTTIIGSNNGEIYLPDSKQVISTEYIDTNTDKNPKIRSIWTQAKIPAAQAGTDEDQFINKWIPITSDHADSNANAIVMTDKDGYVCVPVKGVADMANRVKLQEDTNNKSYPIIFADLDSSDTAYDALKINSTTTNKLMFNPSIGNLQAKRFNKLSLSQLASGDTKFKIAGVDAANTEGKYITINGMIEITSEKSTSSKPAKVMLTPGTLNLPANSTANSQLLAQATAGVSSWIEYTADNKINSIVKRDGQGKTSVQTITLKAYENSAYSSPNRNRSASIAPSGEVQVSDLSVAANATKIADIQNAQLYKDYMNTVAKDKYAFISAISQASDGKITPTLSYIPYASSTVAGTIKVREEVSDIEGLKLAIDRTANRYYPIMLGNDGGAVVNVPWVNTTYLAGKCLKLNGSTFNHNTPVTKKTAAAQAGKTLSWKDKFNIYETLYDDQGHATGFTASQFTMPANPNSAHKHKVEENGPLQLVQTSTDPTQGEVTYTLVTRHGSGLINDPNSTIGTAKKLDHNSKFSIPVINVDKYGLVKNLTSITMELPDRTIYSDTKMIQHNATNNASANVDFPILAANVSAESFSGITSRPGESYASSNITLNPVSGQIKATSYLATSDARLKKNIRPFTYTKSILDLDVKRFDFIDGPKDQIGCIAQELQALYPELVVEGSDGHLSVNESKLVYLLLEEVKILRNKLDAISKE